MIRPLIASVIISLSLAACSGTPVVQTYRIDVRQGNVITQEMVAQLKPGLTKDQVKFILGSPLVVDMFHSDRWDYVYHFKPGKGEAQSRRLTVIFEDGKLARLAGDVVAGDGWLDGPQTTQPANRVIDIPPATKK
ncbi:MAG: outer membrane protein assembly factor BamE [Gammaproteobacteria bacterium]|nr:outer membrane protein assembly factor BamE [Gammaproteobacteria bacterium]MBU1647180.1 outer membrane protein assembly factor BamE [Gammaproteobacteria bacterium]MBU1972692.1 outer membrane protein assembly factor BamE [Gammaproteobacteria bacterium]